MTSGPSSGPSSADLQHSISFDLAIMRSSLFLDILSHTLVSLPLTTTSVSFTGLTVISSFASGMLPAGQSLAICIMQRNGFGEEGLGALFGAISALQAVGQMILGVRVILALPVYLSIFARG